jgi:DNA processing protein
VSASPAAALVAACGRIAALGTDPEQLARVLAAVVTPRRTGDGLRRALRDGPAPTSDAAGHDDGAGQPPGARLADLVGPPGRAAADVAARVAGRWGELAVRVALVGDPGYPQRLAEGWPHTDGPVLLARRGADVPAGPTVALVGARRATGYGTAVAAWLADAAATAGLTVVSGGAVGIDAAAHAAVVEREAPTVVVLGCGHGVRYPRVHASPGGLFDRVLAAGGGLLGELLPDEPPRPGQVRARNRLVAALADVVVVIEGGQRSGALLTATAAADRGRTVLAVPGDVRAPGSVAPHRLLADGVAPCTGPADLLDAVAVAAPGRSAASVGVGPAAGGAADVGVGSRVAAAAGGGQPTLELDAAATPPAAARRPSALPADVVAVLESAWPRPVPLEQLADRAGRPVPALLAALTRARIAGEVAESADGLRLRRAPP